ncbi:MAG: DUF2336 domain-containing protein [Candidatus Obscuribacterales bacterium]|nr:DUF2336 domain-containing protein [Candidatus Obscuribacterales bacterium]
MYELSKSYESKSYASKSYASNSGVSKQATSEGSTLSLTRTKKRREAYNNNQWKVVSKSDKIRMAQAPVISKELLIELADDSDSEVRAAVAERGNLSMQLQVVLCLDDCADVRYAIAEDPGTAISILRRLSKDNNPYVAHRAQRTLFALAREAIKGPDRIVLELDNSANRLFPLN